MMEKGFQAVVLLLISSFPVTEADSCTSGEVKIDTTCPTNCSQEPPRIPGDRVFFKCSIGGQKAVDRYKETHKKDFLPESAVFDAPKVRGVELYWKSYDDGSHFELALKVNFSLPKGILVKSLPKAILLKFESIPGPYEDCYYVENPREKIYEFEFHPIHAYDMVHPRRLQEDCLVGLDHMKAVLVYNITLQTAEGTLASYITTVHVRDTSPRIWKPVIMAFLNETNASLFVVVEKPPSSHNIQSYNVSLVDGQNKISRSVEIKVHDVNTTAFVNLSNFSGQYRIMVRPLCKGNCNRKIDVPTLSYRIVLPGDPGNIKDDSLKPVKVVAIVMGCTFGVLLVLTIICFIHQRPKRKGSSPGIRPYCLLLHPLEKDCVAVTKLKEYISQTCDCKITDCMDLYQKSAGETERMTANRARSHLRDATVFLVLYASDFYNSNATSFHTDFLSCFIKSAINRRQKHNDLRIILLQFPFVTNSELPPLHRKNNIQLLELTNSPDKLYSKLHGLDTVPLNGEDLSTRHNHSQWREVVAALKNNVRRKQNNASTSQGEAEPLLTEKNLQISHEELNKLDEGELLAKIAKINLDSDSVIEGSDGESPRQMLGLPTNKKIKTTAETSSKAKSEHLGESDYHANCLGRFNVNMCKAEVHPMPKKATRIAVGYGDQPFSSPPVFTPGRHPCIPTHSLPVCTNRHIDDRNVDGCPTNYMPHISHEIVDQNPLNHGFHGGHHYQPGLHHAVFPNHHQYHRQIYTDDLQYSAKHLNEACGQNMNDFKEDQRQCERNQSFNAHDPHVTKPIGTSACLDVNTKHELTKQNTEDVLAVRSLVPSLPTDLGIGAVHDADVYNNFDPPDDLHRDSPQLLHESEFGSWESSLMDLFVEFNKNNI